MSEAITKYRRLQIRLVSIQEKLQPIEELEEAILEEMDAVWDELSQEERDQLNAEFA